jgi:hypothetical protein
MAFSFVACAQNETAPATVNVLKNADWSQIEGEVFQSWSVFEGGYSIAKSAGKTGGNAAVMQRQEGDKARGASQNIALEQTAPAPITISGWSKAENVSGAPDADYSVYADLTFQDGSTLWGQHAAFDVGTHDWQKKELVITPEKPVKSITFYALFRVHTGKVWFSNLEVLAIPKAAPVVPMAAVEAVKNYVAKPYIAAPDASGALMQVSVAAFENQLKNGNFENAKNNFPSDWQKWEDGGQIAKGAGRDGSAALVIERKEGDPERGIQQVLVLNQTRPEPVIIEGWSKAENVNGMRDGDYGIYCDVTYTDGSHLWGVTQGFAVGTHDWQKEKLLVSPEKPIKSLIVYALFRKHTGKAWFDDFRAGTRKAENGEAFFDGVPVKIPRRAKLPEGTQELAIGVMSHMTKDKLAMAYNENIGSVYGGFVGEQSFARTILGGFLVRDVANNSGYYPFQNGESAALKLKLNSKIESKENHISISGFIEDETKMDRAVSVVFALPIDARGWTWDNDIRTSQTIAPRGEYSRTQPIGAGSNGNQSVYPVANIRNETTGLALAIDMNFPAQYRILYNADTQQFCVAYDFGLTLEKPRADFRFIVYRTDPQTGFRSAMDKLQTIFPDYFALRNGNEKQGLWMPFLEISKVEKPEDFGFRFREAGEGAEKNGSAAWDDAHDVLTLLYTEPMTYWMSMPLEMPRTYEAALDELRRIAANEKHAQNKMARAVIASGMRDKSGRLGVRFDNQPWANGAVWSISVVPGLTQAGSTPATGASLVWNENKLARLKNNLGAKIDGEYLDSFEGYVSADLNFARDQFAAAQFPLTFSTADFTPAQHKGLMVTEMARWMSREVRGAGGLMMANSIPYRFGFAAPWLDVMGTETNWKTGDKYQPDSDSIMNLRRTLSGPKPYLLLQNTNFDNFSHDDVRRYMERSLFYGMFPSFFSHNAAEDIYWANPKLYNRDRDLFLKYVPVVKQVAEAGWQPLTKASSDNANIWLERFGDDKEIYLTLRNDADSVQTARIKLDAALKAGASVTGVLPMQEMAVQNGGFEISLQPDETAVVRLK